MWLPEKIADQVAVLESHPTRGLSTAAHRCGTAGTRARRVVITSTTSASSPTGLPTLRLLPQLLENRVQSPTTCNALIRRDAYEEFPGISQLSGDEWSRTWCWDSTRAWRIGSSPLTSASTTSPSRLTATRWRLQHSARACDGRSRSCTAGRRRRRLRPTSRAGRRRGGAVRLSIRCLEPECRPAGRRPRLPRRLYHRRERDLVEIVSARARPGAGRGARSWRLRQNVDAAFGSLTTRRNTSGAGQARLHTPPLRSIAKATGLRIAEPRGRASREIPYSSPLGIG